MAHFEPSFPRMQQRIDLARIPNFFCPALSPSFTASTTSSNDSENPVEDEEVEEDKDEEEEEEVQEGEFKSDDISKCGAYRASK